MLEVEILDDLAGGETGRSDPMLPAVVLAGGHLPFQTGGLLVGPILGSGPLRQPSGLRSVSLQDLRKGLDANRLDSRWSCRRL